VRYPACADRIGGNGMSEEQNPRPVDGPDAAQQRRKLSRLEKAKQLRARAAAMEAREAKEGRRKRTRQLIIVGGAAVAEAKANPQFLAELERIVKARVTKDVDVKAVEGWQATI
jgi:hypothetical protein